jgi:hypothetical protein
LSEQRRGVSRCEKKSEENMRGNAHAAECKDPAAEVQRAAGLVRLRLLLREPLLQTLEEIEHLHGTSKDSATVLPVPPSSSDDIIAWNLGTRTRLQLAEREESADDVAQVGGRVLVARFGAQHHRGCRR